MICAIISFLIFVAYISWIACKFKTVPVSLSETYYMLGQADGSGKFNRLRASIFTFMMWAIAILLLPGMLDLTPEIGQFLPFLALVSICFVGAAPEFHDSYENKIHTTSAVFAAFFALSWAIVFAHGIIVALMILAIALITGALTGTLKRSKIWWLEMVAFFTVYASVLALI